MTRLLVLGDSVPNGARTDADGWPRRLPDLVESVTSVRLHGDVGTSLAALSDEAPAVLDGADGVTVLVHAGHNDAQLSGGEPRVSEARFREAAATLDQTLADHPAVDRRAFVGLVPLLRLDAPDSVPFAEVQPERALAYDDLLAEAVDSHVPVARPTAAWRDRTVDGVHPDDAGHAAVAERVAAWLTDGA